VAKEKEAPRKVSRREFVKGAAVGAAGIAAAGALASCAPAATPTTAPVATAAPTPTTAPVPECPPCPTPWIPEKWDEEADVVVCGYGTTGMAAAIDAHDAGADVLIIEKWDEPGGALRRCGGGIVGANTVVQRALGIVDDTPDALYEYVLACGEGYTDPALHRVYADNAGKNVDWIIQDLGGQPVSEWEFSEPMTLQPGLNVSGTPVHFEEFGLPEVIRCHWFKPATEPWADGLPGGTGLFKPFDDSIKAREIRTMLGTTLIELVATTDREVLGIKALSGGKSLYIKAKKGVVLASGGWVNNAKMIRDYMPFGEPGGGIEHSDHAHGEGVIAAHAIGADLINMPAIEENRCDCSGGLRINPKAQVIDVYGDPIPRLYAGGCVAGGSIAYKYPSCGTYVSVAVCFGRIAGTNAAGEEPWV